MLLSWKTKLWTIQRTTLPVAEFQLHRVGCSFFLVRVNNFWRGDVISFEEAMYILKCKSQKAWYMSSCLEFLFTWWGLSGTANPDLSIQLPSLEPLKGLKLTTALQSSTPELERIQSSVCLEAESPGQSTSSIPVWRGGLQPWPSPGPLSPAHCSPTNQSHRQHTGLLLQWSPW